MTAPRKCEICKEDLVMGGGGFFGRAWKHQDPSPYVHNHAPKPEPYKPEPVHIMPEFKTDEVLTGTLNLGPGIIKNNTFYVSGGIKNIPDHRANFARGVDEVKKLGYDALSPLDIGHCGMFACVFPGEMLETGHTWQCFMRFDIAQMVFCRGIYMLQGWEKSKGATEELRICQMLGMEVLFQPKISMSADNITIHG